MTLVMLSTEELARVRVIQDLVSGRIKLGSAAQVLELSPRQVSRLRDRFTSTGAPGLASRRRGRASNHKLPDTLRVQALSIVRKQFSDFGPTFAAEKLKALRGIEVSKETLRAWMHADGIWLSRRQRLKPVCQPRYRREHRL